MALGVMLVVSVLSLLGVVSESFRSNSSFGYNILVGARGGSLQLTMNTVYYLSQPVENVPYEYYLAFCGQEQREQEMRNSFAYKSLQNELDTLQLCGGSGLGTSNLASQLALQTIQNNLAANYLAQTKTDEEGLYKPYTDVAIPLCLGDSYEIENSETFFRCVGTTPDFFNKLVLDIDTEEKFKFAHGRAFESKTDENGFFECVVGALVAKKSGIQVGEVLNPTHGDPNDSGAMVHAQGFKVVGILEGTRTPHDRAVFLNIEGFFLMEDHAKPVEDDSLLGVNRDDDDDEEEPDPEPVKKQLDASDINDDQPDPSLRRIPLPIEQREVTSVLVRTSRDDPYDTLGTFLPPQINQGDLETVLDWSPYRPERSQKAAQAVNPIEQITSLFSVFVDPVRWLLLALTLMICIVSAISILVGIFNSMSQRTGEIAVLRALGAGRWKVMSIMLCESILLAVAGGFIGWFAGHGLNALLGPVVENRTGVSLGFFDFAPGIPLGYLAGGLSLPETLARLTISPELLIIPGLILVALFVGICPAIMAYRTDVSKSLGK